VVAGIKRTLSKKSLAPDSCQQEHGSMFTVHCSGHGGQVLLDELSIVRLANTSNGIEVHWRCTCGTSGVEILGAAAQPSAA